MSERGDGYDSGDHQIGSDCDHDWCLWHDSEVHDGKEVRWCRECEVIQLREPKEDILTDGGTESADTLPRDLQEIIEQDADPFECTCCGHELRNNTCKNPDCMAYGTTFVRDGYRVVPREGWADGE